MGSHRIQNKSLFVSTFITFVIISMLIFSGPAQAISVMLLGLQDKYTQGSSVKFQIEIDINDVDKYVPMSGVSLDIKGPVKKSSTFLLDGTRIDGDDSITIEPFLMPKTADYGYGPGVGYDFGYGYGNNNFGYGYGNNNFGYGYGNNNFGYGYGNNNFGYGYGYGRSFDFGYGYGYGYGYGGYGYGGGGGKLTYIYNVTVNTIHFPLGGYTAVAHLNTGNKVKPSFDSAPATFEIIAPIPVHIEINPKSINPKIPGEIKVTIFNDTPSGFDVAMINISSVKLGKASAIRNQTTPDKLMLFFDTQDTGIKCGDTQVTLTGKTIDGLDIAGIDTFQTSGCGLSGGKGGGKSTGSTGVITSEPTNNIIRYETRECLLTANNPSSCKFTVPEHLISELVLTDKETETVSLRIEALKGLSPRVNVPAPGTFYMNIWSGSKSIQEALIRFTVDISWITSEGLTPENLRMYHWNGAKWDELETNILSRHDSVINYEAKTTAFSNFAIGGIKAEVPATAISSTPEVTEAPPQVTGTQGVAETPGPRTNLYLIIGVFIVILAGAVLYFVRKG